MNLDQAANLHIRRDASREQPGLPAFYFTDERTGELVRGYEFGPCRGAYAQAVQVRRRLRLMAEAQADIDALRE